MIRLSGAVGSAPGRKPGDPRSNPGLGENLFLNSQHWKNVYHSHTDINSSLSYRSLKEYCLYCSEVTR